MQTTSNPLDQNSLFEQMTNITKAHGYDILSEQVKELKEAINELIRIGELEDLTFTDDAATKLFQHWVNRAKILAL